MTVSPSIPGIVGANSPGIVKVSKTNLSASVRGWFVLGKLNKAVTIFSGEILRVSTIFAERKSND